MFDLELSIADWRKQMLAAGIKTPVPLDELEIHLREEIRVRIAGGAAEEQAFETAAGQIGNADSLRKEFNEAHGSGALWITGGWLLWMGLAAVVAVFLAHRLFDGRMGVLLVTHIFSLTVGYLTAFFAGAFAAAYIWMQRFGEKSSVLRQRLASESTRFVDFATVLVALGFALGMLWANQHYHRYWIKDVREIAAFGALTLLMALSVTRRIWQLEEPTQALLGLGASLTVGVAWFGLPQFANGTLLDNCLPLALFTGMHLLILKAALRYRFTKASA